MNNARQTIVLQIKDSLSQPARDALTPEAEELIDYVASMWEVNSATARRLERNLVAVLEKVVK